MKGVHSANWVYMVTKPDKRNGDTSSEERDEKQSDSEEKAIAEERELTLRGSATPALLLEDKEPSETYHSDGLRPSHEREDESSNEEKKKSQHDKEREALDLLQ